MKKLNDKELDNIRGGNLIVALIIIAIIIFICGVFEGFTNPEECNNE